MLPSISESSGWDEEAESRLIESLLLGLPVPNLFFATNIDGSWEVVDGLQRISTLIHFASKVDDQLQQIDKLGPLQLTGLRKLTNFNGLRFDDLPAPIRMNFTKRGMGVTSLSDKSDPATRFDTFERLNRGAVALSDQEVRACIYEGPFNALLRELASSVDFSAMLKLQRVDEANATREELVLKFFAYLNSRANFRGAVGVFLNSYMETERSVFDIAAGRQEFLLVAKTVRGLLPGAKFVRLGSGGRCNTAGELVNEGSRCGGSGSAGDVEWAEGGVVASLA